MLDDLYAKTVADLNARTHRLRRQTLPILIGGWACTLAAIAISRFTLADVPVLVVLPLLGAGTFNFIIGWPIKRR